MKQRYLQFDLLKGVAILLVILGHTFYLTNAETYTHSVLWNLLVSVHMPLFIFISGYFSAKALDLSSAGVLKYWQNKALRLLLPLLFLPTLMDWITRGFGLHLPLVEYLGRYWFTYVLFELFFIFYVFRLGFELIKKVIPSVTGGGYSELAYFLLSIIALSIFPKTLSYLGFKLPNVLLFHKIIWLYKYLVFGYLMARNPWLEKLIKDERFGAFSIFIYVTLLYVEYVCYSWETPFAKGIPITLFAITSFYYLACKFSERTNNGIDFVAYLGRESLPIYLTHYFFLPYLPWLSKFLMNTISNKTQIIAWEFWIGSLAVVMTLIPTLIVIRLIKTNRYLAFLIYGEKF